MYKIYGTGVDLCQISRMKPMLQNQKFLSKCFDSAQIQYIQSKGSVAAASLAGLWAVKEAVLKAMGTGLSVSMTDLHVTHTDLGQPKASLSGKAQELFPDCTLHVSISHEADMAIGFAILSVTD